MCNAHEIGTVAGFGRVHLLPILIPDNLVSRLTDTDYTIVSYGHESNTIFT